jgi:O-antigen ligase
MIAAVAAFSVPALLAGRARSLARVAAAGVLAAVAAAPLAALAARTHTFQDRIADPSSVYSRLATLRAGIGIVADHPLAGVGLANYGVYFDRKFGDAWYVSVDEVAGEGAERSPHNELLGVWAELGVAGALCYALAAVSAAGVAWRRRSAAALALLVAYAVPGLTLRHGVYAEANLFLACALAAALGPAARGARP